jgi:hypothetical protein
MKGFMMKVAATGDHTDGLYYEFSNLTLPDACLWVFFKIRSFLLSDTTKCTGSALHAMWTC